MKTFLLLLNGVKDTKRQSRLNYQFFLKPTTSGVSLKMLVGNELWIALADSPLKPIWCRLRVESIDKITESEVSLGHVLIADPLNSEYFLRLGEPLDSPTPMLSEWSNLPTLDTVVELGSTEVDNLRRISREQTKAKMIPFSDRLFKHLSLGDPSLPPFLQFREILRQVKSAFTATDLYRYQPYPVDWSPFECLAFQFLQAKAPKIADSVKARVKSRSEESVDDDALDSIIKSVDLEVRPIEPRDLEPRSFKHRASDQGPIDFSEMLKKTERAEKAHQNILKNVAAWFTSKGYIPMMSRSLDLFVHCNDKTFIFEIKSANGKNFHSQCMKGAGQLKEYGYAMKLLRNFSPTEVLIVQDIASEEADKYYQGLLKHMGIIMMTYRDQFAWPKKLSGIESLLQSAHKPPN